MDMIRNLPHKPIFIGGAVAFVILGAWVVQNTSWTMPGTSKDYAAQKTAGLPLTASNTAIERDTDHDGLLDWEETLYGTDPKNPDTDGDGTKDGAEISMGRNPLVPNTSKGGEKPNDLIPGLTDTESSLSATDTTALRKEFFANYLKEQGDQIRSATYQDLLKDFNPKKYAPKTGVSAITTTPDNSTEALRAYGNAFGLIIRKYEHTPYRTEAPIIEEAVPKKDSAMLQELSLPAEGYTNFARDLRALTVPSSLGTFHLLVVNGYDGMAAGLRDMEKLFTDPVVGAGGYEGYTMKRVDVIDGYAGIVGVFHSKGVVFASSDPGAPFTTFASTTKL